MREIDSFKISFRSGRSKLTLDFDRNYGIDRRSGWSCAINGSYYVQFVKSPLAAVWTALKKHKASERDMAADELYQDAGGAKFYWDKADAIIKELDKITGDWRAALKLYHDSGSAGSGYANYLAIGYDEAVATAKSLRDKYHGK